MTAELPIAWQGLEEESPRRYVGSGDIAAIVAMYRPELAAMAKWKSAADVWMRLVHGIDLKHKPSMSRGLREENPLRIVYRESVGEVSELPGLIKHPRFDWAGGSPDGLGLDRIVELKTHSVYAMAQWGATTFEEPTDLVPDKYAFQCQWLMGLAGFSLCDLLMGFGRDVDDVDGRPMFSWTETRLYRLRFHAEMFAECERLAERFYLEHVMTKTPPLVMPVENKREWKRLSKAASVESGKREPIAPQPIARGEDDDGSRGGSEVAARRGAGEGAGEDSAGVEGQD